MISRAKSGTVRDTDSRELKFQALADELRRGILAGTWAAGAKLPTEAQLSAETGVSLTTVRRAFDELVQEGIVARRQGAGSFVSERPVARRRTRLRVGVLLPDTQLYYPRVLKGIEETLSAQNVGLQLSTYNYESEREDASIDFLIDSGVDGLILVPTLSGIADPQQRVRDLAALNLPVVLLERSLTDMGPGDRTEHVCSDHQGGAYDAVRHLVGLGHRRVGLLIRSHTPTEPAIVAGYERCAKDLGFAPLVLPAQKEDWESGAAEQLLAQLRDAGITAALVFGDREATFLEAAARRAGVRIPEDLALVSYDDELADLAEVPLTAVAPAKHRMGKMAAEILLRRLAEGDDCPIHQVRLRPRLVIRESCGAKRQPAQHEEE
ncbi:substrate-binding domain-containing protein [Arthrobacter sp. H35-D1]|uniref:GntR family transcriptional regulator n=1 Tax=Arthrobacter sp. H35-D1 TaxID=3046202 RepID=UPI0024BB5BD7|nr:substrate-binding domain-containing protein [Arthrobacter sp. H35-D1]MDJ0314457.1 substrate-binding domain-containing protein [Arthrobacter sp. H35-D1]